VRACRAGVSNAGSGAGERRLVSGMGQFGTEQRANLYEGPCWTVLVRVGSAGLSNPRHSSATVAGPRADVYRAVAPQVLLGRIPAMRFAWSG